MCRVIMFSNFSKIKHDNLLSRVEYAGKLLTKTEKDGFGYAIQGEKGAFGERTVNDYFYSHLLSPVKPLIEKFVCTDDQETFGEVSRVRGGAIFHGRVSTNKSGLINTHPISKHGWNLIHNGVVTHKGNPYEMDTDNDSEHVLENLVEGGIEQVADNLTGYYAFGALDPEGNLHIARDYIATLYAARLPKLETFIFATTRDLIENFCDRFEYDYSPIHLMTPDTYIKFDTTGKQVAQENFESRGFTEYEASFSTLSLGRSLTNSEADELTSYTKYIAECKAVDSTYTFYDGRTGEEVALAAFKAMEEDHWFLVDIVRQDGTMVDYINYDDKKRY